MLASVIAPDGARSMGSLPLPVTLCVLSVRMCLWASKIIIIIIIIHLVGRGSSAAAAPDPSRARAQLCARACDAPAAARSAPFHGSSARAAVPVSAAAALTAFPLARARSYRIILDSSLPVGLGRLRDAESNLIRFDSVSATQR